ncbi:AAEL011270-PA [Aedes aegypti]|uniref:AAEL011270-PA n=1 Tax=Aedes aegypti TaxID=7159 RepID=Q16QJ4_AEDAE|nr:AAEL011270-PA [Aedes aegypti]
MILHYLTGGRPHENFAAYCRLCFFISQLEHSAQEERNGRDEGKCGMCGLSSKCDDYCNRTAGTCHGSSGSGITGRDGSGGRSDSNEDNGRNVCNDRGSITIRPGSFCSSRRGRRRCSDYVRGNDSDCVRSERR